MYCCSALSHTLYCCSALCPTLYCCAALYPTLYFCAALCPTLCCGAVCVLLCVAVQSLSCSVLLCSSVSYSILLWSSMSYSVLLWSCMLCFILLYTFWFWKVLFSVLMSTVYCSNMSLLDCDSDANLIEASLPQHPTDLVLIIQFVYTIYSTGYAGCRGYMIFCVHSLGSQTKHFTLISWWW